MAEEKRVDILQAEKDIEELKEKIVDVNDENIEFEEELKDITLSYQKKMADIKKKHEKAVKTINSETDKLKKELLELDEKSKNVSDTYRKRMDDVEQQISNIKNNTFNVFDKELNQQKEKYEKTKAELNEELETLYAKKNLYVERYNTQIIELDEKFKNLKQKEEDNKNALIKENNDVVEQNESTLKDLEEQKNALIENHRQKLEKIRNDNEKILSDIKSKEDSIFKTLSDQLASFNNQLNTLIAQRDAKAIEVEEENNKLSEELENTKKFNQETIDAIKDANDKLRAEIEQKQAQLKQEAEQHTQNYNKKKEEFEEYVKNLGVEEEKAAADLLTKLNKRDEKFKERLSSLIGGIDKTFENETKRFNQEINTLTYKLDVEKSDFDKLCKLNEDRFAEKKKEYENIVNVLKEENQNLIEKANNILTDYNKRIAEFRLNIIKLQEENKTETELLDAEYSKKIQEVNEELAAKEEKIRKDIIHTNSSIKVYEDNIAKLNNEFKEFSQKISDAKNDEKQKCEAFVNELNEKKAELENSIAAIETEIHLLNTNKIDEIKDFYRNEKEKAITAHKERIANIKKQHEEELEKHKQDFIIDCEQARIDHENRVNNLIDETKKSKEVIEGQIAQIKIDYENHKVKLEELTEKLAKDQSEQIEYYNKQRENIHKQIEEAKQAYLAEKDEYKLRVDSIEAEHEANLERMKNEQEEKIKELVRVMETIPTEELSTVKAKLETVKNNDIESKIAQEKDKIQKEFEEFKVSHDVIREEAQTIFNDVEKTLDFKKKEKEAALETFNFEVDSKKQEIFDYNLRLENDIADIKKANVVEVENLTRQLNEQLAETKAAFNSKYEVIEREYNREIDVLKNELIHKRDDYNILIAESNNKKNILENDYKVKCEEESIKTKSAQDELDRILKVNNDQRAEWSRVLNLRADQIADENKFLIEKYEKALEEKRSIYQKRIDDIRTEIKDIKGEIANNEAAKLDKQSELDLFKMDKKIEMDKIKAQTDEIIANLTEKSQLIVKQSAALEEVHKQKVESYKKRVVELMAQLEELERVRPSIIRETVEEGSNELVRKTEEFKNKIQLLEKTNKEILEKLELRRNQTVEQIKFEISELVSGKDTTLKSHEEDLDRIVRTYEALLRDEASKQADLNEQLVAEKVRIAKEEAKYLADSQNIETEWTNKSEELVKTHEEKQQVLIDEMNPKLKDATIELLNSKEYNEKILSDIESLKEENDRFDKQIIEDKNNLVEEYINKLEDINNLFVKSKEEEKERLKDVDILSESILDLFKKH